MAATDSLDTNCLLRWLLEDLPAQANAVNQRLASGNHHVADMAIQEFVYALERLYGYPRELIAANVEIISAHPNINCNRGLLKPVLARYLDHPALSFVDCCLTVYAELNDATPLLTFDKKLARQLEYAKLLEA